MYLTCMFFFRNLWFKCCQILNTFNFLAFATHINILCGFCLRNLADEILWAGNYHIYIIFGQAKTWFICSLQLTSLFQFNALCV